MAKRTSPAEKAAAAAAELAALKAETVPKANLTKNGAIMNSVELNPDGTPKDADPGAETPNPNPADDGSGAEDEDEDEEEELQGKELPPGVEPKARFTADRAYDLTREVIDAALAAGDLRVAGWWPRKVGKNITKTDKDEYYLYEKLQAINLTGATILCHGRVDLRDTVAKEPGQKKKNKKGVWDYWDYGFDLEAARPMRTKFLKILEGPGKAIGDMADMMVLHKFPNPLTLQPYTRDEAIAAIKASRAAAGMDV